MTSVLKHNMKNKEVKYQAKAVNNEALGQANKTEQPVNPIRLAVSNANATVATTYRNV